MTIEQMREILGDAADGKTNQQLEKYITELQGIASLMYADLIGITEKEKAEDVRWAAYLHEHALPLEQDDRQFWDKYGAEAIKWP
jgi:hypothetical protein